MAKHLLSALSIFSHPFVNYGCKIVWASTDTILLHTHSINSQNVLFLCSLIFHFSSAFIFTSFLVSSSRCHFSGYCKIICDVYFEPIYFGFYVSVRSLSSSHPLPRCFFDRSKVTFYQCHDGKVFENFFDPICPYDNSLSKSFYSSYISSLSEL